MTAAQKIFSCILVLIFISCVAHEQERKDTSASHTISSSNEEVTRIFSTYLNRQFNTKIKTAPHYYILLSNNACLSTVKKDLDTLNNLITKENSERFTFIFTNKYIIQHIPSPLKKKGHWLKDTSKLLDQLNLPISNTTVIKTSQKEVQFIKFSKTGSTKWLDWIKF